METDASSVQCARPSDIWRKEKKEGGRRREVKQRCGAVWSLYSACDGERERERKRRGRKIREG